ncbi:MAG: hypothetical protein HQ582_31500 [Planctomycetes bacterium]|nr:hypothetical protein [Planctomycetota bacterium]
MCTEEPKRISLLDALELPWLRLPIAAMADVGPAVQTLGGLLQLTIRETFVPLSTIANEAHVPLTTAKKHLRTLHDHGWINNKGRQESRAGYLRRTNTIAVTRKTRDNLKPYAVLPWWACCNINFGRASIRLPWGARAVLSIIMAKLAGLAKSAKEEECLGYDGENLAETIDEMTKGYTAERFEFGLLTLEKQTGMSHMAIAKAKRWLSGARIINWTGIRGQKKGTETLPDNLTPNWDFRIVKTPAKKAGYIHYSFGEEVG